MILELKRTITSGDNQYRINGKAYDLVKILWLDNL